MDIHWEKSEDAQRVNQHARLFNSAIQNSIKNDMEVQNELKKLNPVIFKLNQGCFSAETEERKPLGKSVESESFPKNITASVVASPMEQDTISLKLVKEQQLEVNQQTRDDRTPPTRGLSR